MSQENVELTHRLYAALSRHDLNAFLAFMDPKVVAMPRILAVEGGALHGHDGIREWWNSIFGTFPDFDAQVTTVWGIGDLTVASVRTRGRGQGSGASFEDAIWVVSRVRDGKVTWWQTCGSEAEALEAAGLSELAMSRENVEIVRRGLELFDEGDIDRVLEGLHPEIELTPGIGPMLGVATITGRDAVRRFWEEELPQALDEFRIEPFRFDDYGQKTLVEATYTAHAPSSGMDIRQNFATVYLIEDGLIRSIDDYTTRKDALEAAGLSE